MDYVRFGSTGLEVSRLCLGCMTYGVPERGTHPWTLGEDAARPLIRQALDAGITFFDTANVYSDGTSEEIVGRALLDFVKRDDVVIAVAGRHADEVVNDAEVRRQRDAAPRAEELAIRGRERAPEGILGRHDR